MTKNVHRPLLQHGQGLRPQVVFRKKIKILRLQSYPNQARTLGMRKFGEPSRCSATSARLWQKHQFVHLCQQLQRLQAPMPIWLAPLEEATRDAIVFQENVFERFTNSNHQASRRSCLLAGFVRTRESSAVRVHFRQKHKRSATDTAEHVKHKLRIAEHVRGCGDKSYNRPRTENKFYLRSTAKPLIPDAVMGIALINYPTRCGHTVRMSSNVAVGTFSRKRHCTVPLGDVQNKKELLDAHSE